VEGDNSKLTPDTCPGFGQDRVNFHQNPGRGTAGWADSTPTWPNRAGYSIPCALLLGSGGDGGAAGTLSRLGSAQQRFDLRERFCSVGLFCVFPFSVSSLFLFPLFAVLLNCPYPDSPVFCLFSFHSPPHSGRGRGSCVALLLPAAAETRTTTNFFLSQYISNN